MGLRTPLYRIARCRRTSWMLLALLAFALPAASLSVRAQTFPANSVVAWGANVDGHTRLPTGLSDVTAIAAGGVHSLALTSDGTVVTWAIMGTGKRACRTAWLM